MSQGRLTTLIVVYLVAVGAMWTWIGVAGLEPKLGLDLQGGLAANLAPIEGAEFDDEVLDRTVDIIRDRVDALGVAEPEIVRQGDTIQVQLPGVADEEQAGEVIGRTAQLQFRRVVSIHPAGSGGPADTPCQGEGEVVVPEETEEVTLCQRTYAPGSTPGEVGEELPPEEWDRVVLSPVPGDDEGNFLSGESLADARAALNPNSFGTQWFVELDFKDAGADLFATTTGELACLQGPQRQLAIVLDAIVEEAPPVAEDVPCGTGITGGSAIINSGGETDARETALVLKAGALPIQLEFENFETISPTLGRDSLSAGILAGLIGLVLVAIYLVVLYRGVGFAAVLELLMFGITVLGLIIVLGEVIGFTLTLAGIAGVIVSIGIAADSSIIYRERYRDEVRAGRTFRTAADHAFTKAFRTNLTGNTVSFLAALVLYLLAVGPVRGFAFTLGLSTLIDTLLFATFTRGVFGLIARSQKLADAPYMGLRAGITSEQLEQLANVGGRRRRTSKSSRKARK